MVFRGVEQPLALEEFPVPACGSQQVLIKIIACAVCRTDLHVVDGDLTEPKLPLIPGHEIVGEVVDTGDAVPDALKGKIVGVPWLGETCGHCDFCLRGEENLCDSARFTGYTLDGGYAEYCVAHQHFVFEILGDPLHAAPLLCAGLIGYRCLRMAGDAQALGMYGFGAAAHIISQVAISQGRRIHAFTRPGDMEAQQFAMDLGAQWAGNSGDTPPEPLDAAIIFAPVGELVVHALKAVRKGGMVVCGGIHMSPIPEFAYDLLWGERKVCSVANLTRQDGEEFFALLEEHPVTTHITRYPLEEANEALDDLRHGRLQGAAVLIP
ncbi:MAG: zinc-dependent alcohol dehydrogenase family protein [Halieaceae bacterium]|jgi:propanol-preferring alcohol dehydrogenase|nr:zinc-dependent alcohol dehydrogenase family protein [Halieaceae bacterium]